MPWKYNCSQGIKCYQMVTFIHFNQINCKALYHENFNYKYCDSNFLNLFSYIVFIVVLLRRCFSSVWSYPLSQDTQLHFHYFALIL